MPDPDRDLTEEPGEEPSDEPTFADLGLDDRLLKALIEKE